MIFTHQAQQNAMIRFVSFVTLIAIILAGPSENIGQKRIINGENAHFGEFPYQVLLLECMGILCEPTCGGTIITPRAVLTAAHCYKSNYTHKVVVGITKLSEATDDRQVIKASGFTIHEDYIGDNIAAPHDIGIIHLTQSIAYSANIQPAVLPIPGAAPTGSAVLSGWGSIGATYPDHLQKATKVIIDIDECEKAFKSLLPAGYRIPLEKSGCNICTSGRDLISHCSGDSGGPLTQNGVVIGVVSWGLDPCGILDAPSVFVAVSHYIEWIHRHTTDLNVKNPKNTYRLRTY